MSKALHKKSGNRRHKLLAFDQPGDFYHRRALRHLENEEYIKAIWHLKQAIGREPANNEYRLDLAGVLSDIERFDDSNQEIFLVMQSSGELPAECYYGLGCNYYGMNKFDKAAESLSKYLDIEPEGTYSEDAQWMLQNIFSAKEEVTDKENINDDAHRGLHIINGHNTDSEQWAIDLIAKVLMCFVEGKLEKAMTLSQRILDRIPDDFNALCMLALCANRLDQREEAIAYAKKAAEVVGGLSNELQKLTIVLCDLGLHELVVRTLKRLKIIQPYNGQTLHYLALGYYNTGDYRSADKIWESALKMNPDDLVTNWYLDACRQKLKGEGPDHFDYTPQIPPNAINNKITYINNMLNKYSGPSPELWSEQEFKKTVIWAADLPDTQIQRAMLHIIFTCGEKSAEEYFRTRLLSKHDIDEVKRDVYAYLKRMDAKEPYYAQTKQGIAEVRVSMIEVESGELPQYYREVLELALKKMEGEYSPYFAVRAIKVWTEYLRSRSDKSHRIMNVSLWAAGVECMYRYDAGQPLDMVGLGEKYHVRPSSLRRIWRILKKYMDEERID